MKPEISRRQKYTERETAVLKVKNKELNISRLGEKESAEYLLRNSQNKNWWDRGK
jgi:hypothetical protein